MAANVSYYTKWTDTLFTSTIVNLITAVLSKLSEQIGRATTFFLEISVRDQAFNKFSSRGMYITLCLKKDTPFALFGINYFKPFQLRNYCSGAISPPRNLINRSLIYPFAISFRTGKLKEAFHMNWSIIIFNIKKQNLKKKKKGIHFSPNLKQYKNHSSFTARGRTAN